MMKEEDTPLIQQYKNIKMQHQDKILFFCCGDFFEMFFQDAVEVSSTLGLTLTSRKNGVEKVPMCGIPVGNKDFYIKKLLEKGYKVALCEQGETPDQAKQRGAKLVQRHITAIYTAGTYLDNTTIDYNYILSLYEENGLIYSFYIDISTEAFYYERIHPDHVLNLIQRVNPKEIIVSDNNKFNFSKWDDIVTELSIGDIQIGFKDIPNIKEFLTYSSNGEIIAIHLLYMHLTNTFNKMPNKRPITGVNSRETTLDSHTIQNLNLLTHFYQLMNRCYTAMGKRTLKQWILKPLLYKEDILLRQDLVGFFYNHIILDSHFYNQFTKHIRSIGDMNRHLFLLSRGKPTIQSIEQLLTSFKSSEELITLLCSEEQIPEIIRELVYSYKPMGGYKELAKVFVPDEQWFNREFLNTIYGEKNLQDILYQITTHRQEINKYIPSAKLNRNSIINYYFEITPKDRILLENLPRYIIKQTLLGSIRFTTETLIKLESDLLLLEETQERIRSEILDNLLKQIRDDREKIDHTIKIVELLDIGCSFAKLAVENNYSRPNFVETGEISYKNGRNPIIEQYKEFINNDLDISADCPLLFITGPNMGGKSTFMRTIALIILMSQIGSFIPAEHGKITIMQNIFVRIGFGDEEKEGESTFYKEMRECANILNQCDQEGKSNQLILFDEICRGTSYEEGMGLSEAIIEYLIKKKVYVLLSSHYLSLGKKMNNSTGVFTMYTSYLYENNILKFLYKMIPGVSDLSFGVKVGEMAGLPKSIIHRAEELLKDKQ